MIRNISAIITALALLIVAYFMATQPFDARASAVSAVGIIMLALPCYTGVLRSKPLAMSAVCLVALGIYALLIESSALATGFPYGTFTYNNVLGDKVFGLTPWTVAFAYPPILLLAYVLARKLAQRWYVVVLLCATLATAIDLVLDPAAVALGFWQWDEPGFYYGVPLVNFLGWLLTGSIGGLLLLRLLPKPDSFMLIGLSGVAIIWLWTWVNIFLGHVVPSAIGASLIVFIVWKLHLSGTIKA